MKSRQLLPAIALGVGLTVILFLLLSHPATVARANPGTYYVRAGATGDCLSITTPCGSVQEAINLATVSGDQVWIAAGTYTENLTITHSVELHGGWNTSFTVQNPTSTPTALDGRGEHNVRVENTLQQDQITIEGLTLRNGRDGIHIWSGNVTVENCTIVNMLKQGLEIDGGTVSISATQILTTQQGIEVDAGTVQVTKVRIAHARKEGLLIEGGGVVTFTNSIIEDCTEQGIQVDQGNVWIFNNYIHDVISDGIHVNGGSVSIISNTITAIQSDGIDTLGSQTISGNLVYNIVNRGIYAHDGMLNILNNTVRDTGRDAIRIANGMTVLIQGNRITNAGNDGIDARGMSVTVADNYINGTRDRGINAENGALTIVDNTIYNTDGDGIRTAGSSTQVEIRGNTVTTAGNDGIDARGDVIVISRNTVRGCADNGIRSEGDVSARIEANWMLDNGIGLAIRGAPIFAITNNVIGDHVTASVELTGTGSGTLYHNTLVGSGTGVQGTGLVVIDPLTVTLVNNIVVSHNVGISATAGATLVAYNTLLWANGDDPVGGSAMILAPPLFVAPAQQDYHLLPGSPAIDAGTADAGVSSDIDGEPRPIGDLPDIGADEFPAALSVTKQANPILVQPGAPLTYTIRVTNTGLVTLTATVTDVLPDHVSPTVTHVWTSTTLTPGAVWTETVVVTVDAGYVGPLVNVVQATSDEGAADIYTHTLAPDLQVTKKARSNGVMLGGLLTYTIYVTNTGNFGLNATITDVLPGSVIPIAPHTWTATIAAPGDVWTATLVVTVATDHTGPLVNVVQATSDEGATDIYTHTLTPDLEVVKRATPDMVNAGERLTYTIYVTNTGDFHLNATITDTLPVSITSARIPGGTIVLPGERIVWTPFIPAPGGVWTETVVVTVAEDYAGPLVNLVQVTTDEGATGTDTETSTVIKYSIYLPLVLRNYQPGVLQNTGFEGITCAPGSPPGWCWDNWTHDTHNGETHDNIFTPQGWVTWWREDGGYGQPEVKTIPRVPPFTGELERIRSGNYAVLLFTFYRLQNMGLYQVVTGLPPGATVQFSAYAHGWSCDSNDPIGYSCGDPWNQTFQVGIEPDGIADPFSSSIVWSAEQTSPDYYSLIGPITAQVGANGRAYVYLRSKTKWAYEHGDAYWDDTELIVQPLENG
ncbi:MAG: right-handed parallel beta-helix repeat-containing protein [Anaerolineae bacterium]